MKAKRHNALKATIIKETIVHWAPYDDEPRSHTVLIDDSGVTVTEQPDAPDVQTTVTIPTELWDLLVDLIQGDNARGGDL